jgi:REP element-mobilizing transposase RayT
MDGCIYWINFRLADALPQEKLRVWKEECDAWLKHHPKPWIESVWKEYDERFGDRLERWLDAGLGSRSLARPDIREAVKECLMRFDGERLRVHSVVIMPTHVHLLLEPLGDNKLPLLLKGIKGASARRANQIRGASGPFWLDESYDHIVRSEEQYGHFLRYIAENPVKAHLRPDEYWHYYNGDTDILVCDPEGEAGIPACGLFSEPTDTNVCATVMKPTDTNVCATVMKPTDTNVCATVMKPTDTNGCATVMKPTDTNVCATLGHVMKVKGGAPKPKPPHRS